MKCPDRTPERQKWEHVYEAFDLPAFLSSTPLEEALNRELFEYIQGLGDDVQEILEAGCGSGQHSASLAKAGYTVTAMDFAENALDVTKRLFAHYGVSGEFLHHDLFQPIPRSCDLVFNVGTMEHYTEEEACLALANLADSAKKYVLILVPNAECHWYWIYRQQAAANGQWPWGKEIPLTGYREIAERAGLHYVGKRYLAASWTESFVRETVRDAGLRETVLETLRWPIIPLGQKSYLVAFLMSKSSDVSLTIQKQWAKEKHETPYRESVYVSTISDLAAELTATRTLARPMHQELETLKQQHDALSRRLARMSESLSWRSTAPLRKCLDTVGAIQRRIAPWSYRNSVTRQYDETSPYDEKRRTDYSHVVESRQNTSKGVLVIAATIDWETVLHQRPHHMAREMARRGYIVIYHQDRGFTESFQEVDRNVFLCAGNWTWEWLTNLSDATISIYSTSMAFRDLKRALPTLMRPDRRNRIVYEFIDHVSPKVSGDAYGDVIRLYRFVQRRKREVLFLASATELAKELSQTGRVEQDRLELVPNGVDVQHFRNALANCSSLESEALADTLSERKPIVGYYGALAPWLDYRMIQRVAECLPEFVFLLIGPDYLNGSKSLPKRRNIQWIGPKDYDVLPYYAKHFDVAMIPFGNGRIAQTTSPLKLFEYFALEKPVVVTSSMWECTAFPEVFSGDSPSTFATAIREAMAASNDTAYRKRLAELAESNSWAERARVMDEFLQAHLGHGAAG